MEGSAQLPRLEGCVPHCCLFLSHWQHPSLMQEYTLASASLTAPSTSPPTALCLPVISPSSLSHSSQDGQHVNRKWLREKRKRRDVGWKTSAHLGNFPATEVRPCLRCGHLRVTAGAQPLELSNSRLKKSRTINSELCVPPVPRCLCDWGIPSHCGARDRTQPCPP